MKILRVIVLTAIVSLFASAGPPQQQPGYKPVASSLELMQSIIIPASTVIFDAAMAAPANDKDWTTLLNNSIALAESGNLLMMRAPSKDSANWMKYSRALVDAGETAVKAAKAKQVDAVLDAGDVIYGTCDDCHKVYMNK